MSKEMWIAAHEKAVEEAMEANPEMTWDEAYASRACEERANEIYRDRYADLVDWAMDRVKDEKLMGPSKPTST